ncbi:hypothetical protein, partial [Nocardia brasiliensis]|uniref:hypothetical protein n=1 Tax=Nocardia brasiliensis TaxID=37326 RepID=UPI0024581BB7
AAARNGVRSMVGFSYRRVPALALARNLVAQGRIGTVVPGDPGAGSSPAPTAPAGSAAGSTGRVLACWWV